MCICCRWCWCEWSWCWRYASKECGSWWRQEDTSSPVITLQLSTSQSIANKTGFVIYARMLWLVFIWTLESPGIWNWNFEAHKVVRQNGVLESTRKVQFCVLWVIRFHFFQIFVVKMQTEASVVWHDSRIKKTEVTTLTNRTNERNKSVA